eukprot:COSAG06_NODE_21842_length_743_cov_1.290373_1_plen_175_part_10
MRQKACCGIEDQNVLVWLGATLLFGCFGGFRKGKGKGKGDKNAGVISRKNPLLDGHEGEEDMIMSNPIFGNDDDDPTADPGPSRILKAPPSLDDEIESGTRVRMVRAGRLRKANHKTAKELFAVKAGDVLVVEDKGTGKDGVERVLMRLDMEEPANKHHKKGHKQSGWLRPSDKA